VLGVNKNGELFNLDGKVAVVVGGTGAIGAAIAESLADFGADIMLAGQLMSGDRAKVEEEKARSIATSIRGRGRRAEIFFLDISERESSQSMARHAIDTLGGVDILMNCAGMNIRNNVLDIRDEDWDAVQTVNLKGILFCCQAVVPSMMERGGGKIVNIASISSVLGHPARASYAASKGGLIQLSRVMATEFAPHKICVNCISPAAVDTPFIDGLKKDRFRLDREIERIPLGRIAVPGDITGSAVLFASGASDFITGQNLLVDGGRTVD
jgi:NAD(P)-dependent dehydrogenase (short-subunit alcohol dehydrogenase family)